MKNRRKPLIIIGILVLIIVVILVVVASGNKKVDYKGANVGDGSVEIDGKKYIERSNVDTYLIFGVDDYSTDSVSDSDTDIPPQCDVIELLAVDRTEHTVAVISIDRDTMTEVYSYDEDGEVIASAQAQIEFAHIHGYTDEQCCKSVADSVSSLFYGITIDKYLRLDMDSVGIINNLAGGVTVTVEDDFSAVDATLAKGQTIKLTDEQAETFVRGRRGVGDGTNKSRMNRQKQFMDGARTSLEEQYKSDAGFIDELMDALDPVMFTDMTGNDFSKIANAFIEYEDLGTFTYSGESEIGEDNVKKLYANEDEIAAIAKELLFTRA